MAVDNARAFTFDDLTRRGLLVFSDGYRTKASELGPSGFPILRVSQVMDGRVTEGTTDCVRKEFASKIGLKLSQKNDVLLTTKGTFGRRAIIRDSDEGYVYSPQLCWFRVRDSASIDARYLYYWLASREFTSQARGMKSQTDMADYLSLRDLGRIVVALPAIDEQEAIAGILASLDDKIELNRRMADTLDEIAKTLFRLWFVEPVGRAWPSGGEGLPEGWKVERLGEHVDAVRGLSYSSANLGELGEGLPMHNLNSISFAHGYQPSGLKWFTGPYKERNRAAAGELLVANVDVTQNLEVIGSPAIVPSRFGVDSVFSADLFRVDPKPGTPLTVPYLYMLLRDSRLHRIVVGFANGTTVNHLSPDALSVPRIVVPPRDLVEQFDKVVRPMLERRDELESENDTLCDIRDTLLPPLLDGRIEVPTSADGEAS